jgi:cysteinyl-tRNA synthetase
MLRQAIELALSHKKQLWCCELPFGCAVAPMSRNREWFAPPGSDGGALLQFYNSLVDEKVPFIPAAGAGSKQITWYACGPTVYDSAHMGHARNYVTFDVIRRVLEDYFGYNVLYVMNVTDVDDKIILRARRNHLLQRYREQESDPSKVGGCKCGRDSRQPAGKRLRQLGLLQRWPDECVHAVNLALMCSCKQ